MERLFGSRHGACKNIGRKQRNRQFRSHNSWLGFRFTAVNVWSELATSARLHGGIKARETAAPLGVALLRFSC